MLLGLSLCSVKVCSACGCPTLYNNHHIDTYEVVTAALSGSKVCCMQRAGADCYACGCLILLCTTCRQASCLRLCQPHAVNIAHSSVHALRVCLRVHVLCLCMCGVAAYVCVHMPFACFLHLHVSMGGQGSRGREGALCGCGLSWVHLLPSTHCRELDTCACMFVCSCRSCTCVCVVVGSLVEARASPDLWTATRSHDTVVLLLRSQRLHVASCLHLFVKFCTAWHWVFKETGQPERQGADHEEVTPHERGSCK